MAQVSKAIESQVNDQTKDENVWGQKAQRDFGITQPIQGIDRTYKLNYSSLYQIIILLYYCQRYVPTT